ncbi:SGNH/GDSL hydrolase family protein [Noviherbaspirillum sp.]|uniref:SGNH/GDSL hydrolase family protein n=1 Tax=Noviherbaspirillum sp. TaxID=1926288 RepID=UPI002D4B40D9|nr:SGNH/GDSL hydrolase family protein [Noviherbaspirillum sp.]HZW23104.1 SGNH/GDSL hydrolase family protein [Noviherbaspirillum sp.]
MKASAYPSLLVLSLILAACGGGGSGDASTPAATVAPVATEATPSTSGGSLAVAAPSDTAGTPAAPAAPSNNTTKPATDTPAAPVTPTTPTNPATPTTPTAPTTPAAPELVEYYGDSTVWGYRTHTGGQVSVPPPVAFTAALPNPAAFTVRNEGVSGSTACGLLNGTDGRHQPWASQMAASKARYVFVNHAINDQWTYDLNTYKGCLRSLARTAKQYGKQMIFETPNPTRDDVGIMANAMKEVAAQEGVPVVDQYKYLSEYLNGQSAYAIVPDGLHPTEAVYVMKGKYAASVFTSLFIK